MSPEFITIGMFVGLLIGLFLGHPLAFVLGGLAVIFGYFGDWGTASFYMFLNRTWGIMDNYILVCIPLFIFMAQLLDQSGVAEELFDTMRYLFGPIRGGMAVAVVVVATLFGACTGIIGASVVTMGLLSMPVMLKYNYNKRLASGAVCAGGTLGILIPPSIMLVVMGPVVGVPVTDLFAAAIFPGLILASIYIGYTLIRCWISPALGPPLPMELRATSFAWVLKELCLGVIPVMTLILATLGSIMAGMATPTEGAAAGAFGALVLTMIAGTPAISFIGSIGAALTLGLKHGGLLRALLILPLCVGMGGFFAWAMVEQLVRGRPVGNQPMPDLMLMILGPLFILFSAGLLWLMWAARLVTEVRDDGIYIRFHPFQRGFRGFLWEEVESFEACTYRPILEYGGWGIRSSSTGRAYNVSGNTGLQLTFRYGLAGGVLIGSQRPEELAMAVESARLDAGEG